MLRASPGVSGVRRMNRADFETEKSSSPFCEKTNGGNCRSQLQTQAFSQEQAQISRIPQARFGYLGNLRRYISSFQWKISDQDIPKSRVSRSRTKDRSRLRTSGFPNYACLSNSSCSDATPSRGPTSSHCPRRKIGNRVKMLSDPG